MVQYPSAALPHPLIQNQYVCLTLQTNCARQSHISLALVLAISEKWQEVASYYGRIALEWVSGKGHFEIAKLLPDKGANVNNLGGSDRIAREWASAGGHFEIAELLRMRGAAV